MHERTRRSRNVILHISKDVGYDIVLRRHALGMTNDICCASRTKAKFRRGRVTNIIGIQLYILIVKQGFHAILAQLGERKTEDLEVACSIQADCAFFFDFFFALSCVGLLCLDFQSEYSACS